MNQIRKEDIRQEVFDLYDDYAHNRVTRRDFMQRLSAYAVGGLTVTSLMGFLMPDYAGAVQIPVDDPRITSGYVSYPSPKGGGTIKALLSMPKGETKKLGGVVVVHENRGAEPSYRRCGQKGRSGRLCEPGAGCADSARRLSGQ